MRLDRNVNVDGRGKYALINLRKATPDIVDESVCVPEFAVTWGGDDQFFVIKYKDKFAAAALAAYAAAIAVEIESLRTQLGNCETDIVRTMIEEKINELMEYQVEMEHEARIAERWPNRRIPD
jgi:hypothetical protein